MAGLCADAALKDSAPDADEPTVDAPDRTRQADLVRLRERLDDLGRRRLEALDRPAVPLTLTGRRQLEAMRFELAEVEWHLAQLESH